MSDKAYIDKLEKLFKKSVADYVQKVDKPYGIFLSGGVDSGLLTALANPRPDIAFTCRFPYGEKYDEFEYAKKIVKYLGIKKHEIIELTKDEFHKYLPEAVKMFGMTTHFSLVPLYMLFKRVAEMGIKDIFSGEGPDEYLGGYSAYTFLTQETALYGVEELKNYHYALDKYLGPVTARFARIFGVTEEEVKEHWGKYNSLLSNMGYADLKIRGIESMELKLAEEWGVNFHYPYMTSEIEKFCFEECPDELKIKGFTTKWIEKKVAENYLPADVVWRKNKMGGPVAPVGIWLKEKNEFDKEKYLDLQREHVGLWWKQAGA